MGLGLVLAVMLAILATKAVTKIHAASTAYVQVVGSSKILFSDTITLGGCSVKDESNVIHTYTTALAICALDAASKQGGFTYQVKDFGGNLGLFVDAINTDTTPSDFSKFWSYNYNGQQAQNGVSNQIVNSGDVLSFQYTDPSVTVVQQAATWAINYLKSQQTTNGDIQGFSGVNAWASVAFSSAGIESSTVTNGGSSLLDYLKANPPASTAAATDFEKAILAITAAGQNPFDFGGVNYEGKLESLDNNAQIGVPTQINDDVFGLLALIASGAKASNTVKQDALNFIIKNEQSDGGFSWSTTGSSDVDDTAAALQALVSAQNNGLSATGLSDAINKAKTFMLDNQKADGSFVSNPTDTGGNTASTAWAAMALHALGMDNSTQMTSALMFIRGNQKTDGSFAWQAGSTGETFTTSYAIPALEEKSWPIDIYSGNGSASPTPTVTPTPSPTIGPTTAPTATPTPTQEPTVTPTPTETVEPTTIPNNTPTPTVLPSPSVTASVAPSAVPTPTGTQANSQHRGKHIGVLLKDIRKQIDQELRELRKRNQAFSEQVRRLIKNITMQLHALFK